MAHAQKPDFVFRRKGRIHLNRRGRQFGRMLTAEVCASALVMLDTPRSEVVWVLATHSISQFPLQTQSRVRLKPDGTRWRTGGEGKGKLANGVGNQYAHITSECGVSIITNADAHNLAVSSRLNWRPRRFKWTRPFRRKTKSGFCACAITFQTHSTASAGELSLTHSRSWTVHPMT